MRVGGRPRRWRGIVAMASCACLGTVIVATSAAASSPTPSAAGQAGAPTVIATYRARIPELMAEQDIPGLAVALVDGDGVLWAEGFGHPDRRRLRPGHGRHDLQRPVDVEALHRDGGDAGRPGRAGSTSTSRSRPTCRTSRSTARSRSIPSGKITLRMLLSHTAGFTHEAPVGNNDELDPGDLRRPRPEHLRHLAPIPGRHRLRLLEPRHRPRRLHPRASARATPSRR